MIRIDSVDQLNILARVHAQIEEDARIHVEEGDRALAAILARANRRLGQLLRRFNEGKRNCP